MSSLLAEHLATNHRGHLATRASGQDRVNQYMSRVPTKDHRMAQRAVGRLSDPPSPFRPPRITAGAIREITAGDTG